MKNLKIFGILFLSVFTVVSCSEDEDDDTFDNSERASVTMRLVDDPADYQAVYVDVQDVLVKYDGEQGDVSLESVNEGVYNLLELTAGNSVLLVNEDIPEGTISQIRLVLGSENTIVTEQGTTYDLASPSAQQSGLKIQVHEDLDAGISYEFILDFDVEESIVVEGNGSYSLKPVIRASLDAETGAIKGNLISVEDDARIIAVSSDEETEISTHTNAEGEFLLAGVPSGTYTLKVESDTAGEPFIIIESNVSVETGAVTDLGLLTM